MSALTTGRMSNMTPVVFTLYEGKYYTLEWVDYTVIYTSMYTLIICMYVCHFFCMLHSKDYSETWCGRSIVIYIRSV